ncbi:MAG: PDZ domain-containing protein [Rhodospirillaceae bacterium]|nr:PDZ domain-containing protein [Rhodospirillaceae bacterium]MBT5013392.1 PDZ domain-containing protein [Rhodospirillaceae bacterium]MBT7356233.1 PDZ domain-containing protein [Rhodospirillaceae bacterium]
MIGFTHATVLAGLLGITASDPAAAQPPMASHGTTAAIEACVPTGRWIAPATGRTLEAQQMIADMARRPVVLLGETHTSEEDHRWQLQTIAALFGRNPNMVIGFESFPRAAQPVLDRWTRGELSKQEFLEQSRWNEVWRYDASLYMGLFDFVRMHRIPMRALNVDMSLPRRIGEHGRDGIPESDMEGVGAPAPPADDYRQSLREIFDKHVGKHREDRSFDNFVAAQQTWDRAMAEALADARTAGGNPLVIGIIGSGHLEYKHGVPAQLLDLGIDNAAVLLTWDRGASCEQMASKSGTPVADAVFGTDAPAHHSTQRPKLGVMIETTGDGERPGARVARVVEDSVASAAGLKKGDVVINAASMPIENTAQLIALIQRHSPGTWLPMTVLRDGVEKDIVAKFPALQP